MRERMAYLHIPKSAGTSLRVALFEYFPIEVHAPWRLDPILYGTHPRPAGAADRLHHDGAGDLGGYRFMAGHLSLPTIELGFDAADVACVLREPRARLLSQYTFWRTYSLAELEYWLPYPGNYFSRLPFGEFLAHPALAHFVDNLTARMLVGSHPLIPLDGPITAVDEVAELGRAAIDRLGFVDLLERGDAVYEAFDAWFGSPLRHERVNETDPGAGIPVDVDDLRSPTTLRLLDERNRIDRQLWHHAAERVGLAADAADALASTTLATALDRVERRAVAAWERLDTAAGVAIGQ